MNEVFGLPAHPLLVHIPVVLLPLAALGVVLCLVVPRWRSSLIYPTAVIGIVGAVGAILASQAGEWLQERVPESQLVSDHQQLGEMARNLSILFAGALFLWALRELIVVQGRFSDTFLKGVFEPKWVGAVLTVGVVAMAGLTTAWVIQAGHSGAKAAWKGKVRPPGSPGLPPPGSAG